jgi:hopanoid biosynthesis associated protein HpnK
MPSRKILIVTADDFGSTPEVNEAVERAHREGILTSASLMIGAPAAADALARARRLPQLAIGLHVVLTDGLSLLGPSDLPRLVDAQGRFRGSMAAVSFRLAADPALRREIRREIRAQFEACRRAGLRVTHADSHKHFHTHPLVFEDLVSVGRDYGLRSLRLPYEPSGVGWSIAGTGGRLPSPATLAMILPLRRMRRRCRELGIATNDCVLGLRASGSMDAARVLRALRSPVTGTVELYLHPATVSGAAVSPSAALALHEAEYRALLDHDVKRAVRDLGWTLSTYNELSGGVFSGPS